MKRKLLARIAAQGALQFDDFMQMCLYDSEMGFFSSGGVRSGERGDFVTSPEVSPWFGRLLGRWAAISASPDGSILVEVGSGSGSLLAPLVDEVGSAFSGVFVVETSAAARAAAVARVPGVTAVPGLADLPPAAHAVVIVNEVLDNLPVRLVERVGDQWVEFKVVSLGGAMTLEQMRADEALGAWCDLHLADVPEGRLFTVQAAVERWIGELLGSYDSLAVCVIDYAATTTELGRRRRSDVVRTYRRQRGGFDFLDRPGETDITVDVNTDVVERAVVDAGGTVDVKNQRTFLIGLGASDVLRELKDREHACARAGDVMGQLAARSEATNLRAILDEAGLGGFTAFLMSRSTRHGA